MALGPIIKATDLAASDHKYISVAHLPGQHQGATALHLRIFNHSNVLTDIESSWRMQNLRASEA